MIAAIDWAIVAADIKIAGFGKSLHEVAASPLPIVLPAPGVGAPGLGCQCVRCAALAGESSLNREVNPMKLSAWQGGSGCS